MHLTLLLNGSFEPLKFISEREAFRLICKGKVDQLSFWNLTVRHGDTGEVSLPSLIKLKYVIRCIPKTIKFSRINIFKRDQFICQYCEFPGSTSELSMDHIMPQSFGGQSTWKNCVTACKPCNSKKKNRTPEEAGMKLITEPVIPRTDLSRDYRRISTKHPSWAEIFGY